MTTGALYWIFLFYAMLEQQYFFDSYTHLYGNFDI